MTSQPVIHAATKGKRERVIRTADSRCAAGQAAARMRHAEQHLPERSKPSQMTERNARPKHVSRERSLDVRSENVSVVVAAKISHPAQPAVHVVCHGCTAAVEAVAAHTRRARIFANVGITRENIKFRDVLRLRSNPKKRKK